MAAAQTQFGERGFERTTIRSVATAAGVDPALVMHYFGNKQGLFAAVSQPNVDMPDLTDVAPDQVAAVLIPLFVRLWGPPGPFLPLLRAASSSQNAASALLDSFTNRFAPRLGVLAVDHPRERTALIGAHLIGIAVARYIVATPLADMDDQKLAGWLGPLFEQALIGPPPPSA